MMQVPLCSGSSASVAYRAVLKHCVVLPCRTPKASIFVRTKAALLTAARAGKLAPEAAKMRLAALMRVPIKIDQQPAYEVSVMCLL